MKPTNVASIGAQPTDAQLWGTRPVLWGLRMLEDDPAAMILALGYDECREASSFLGIGLPKELKSKAATTLLLGKVRERLDAVRVATDTPCILSTNLHGLREVLDLDEVDTDLVAFRAMLKLHRGFEALAGHYIGLCCDFVFHRKLAYLFGRTVEAIASALLPTGRLVQTGLAVVESGTMGPLDGRLRLLRGLISPLVAKPLKPMELLSSLLPPGKTASLGLGAYPHVSREVALLTSHLRTSLDRDVVGTNILLYGTPGTGKTELSAALSAALHCTLYPTRPADGSQSSLKPRERLRQLMQLQKLVHMTGKSIVLVDEAEDLFPTFFSDLDKTPTKATVNECLETNPVPTIWISNRVGHVDEAFLRRFDMAVRIPPLPSDLRRALLEKVLPPGVLGERELRLYAARRELSPAVIVRMAKVATCSVDQTPHDVRSNLQMLSSQYLKTLGNTPVATAGSSAPMEYDRRLLNTDPPLEDVIKAMSAASFGARMLFHGPPGTGKTAFGKALTETLDKPLLHKQASSLLSCYVGDTEKNLRDMFDEAQREEAILLLDEADSFLSNREGARARWEVTQTNELLTQMEAFDGVFICTTNRIDDLDPAALRRFDFKVKFHPLRPDQQLLLVRQCCAALGIETEADADRCAARMRQVEGLTPGDAAAALRRLSRMAGVPDVDTLMDALADECRYKPHAPKPMGFLP